MRLAIVNLTSGGLSGGYLKYLRKMLPALKKQPGIDELTVYVPPQMEGFFDLDTINILSWPIGNHKRGFSWIKEQIRKTSPDFIFIPTARYIDFGHIPTVIMVRNMEPLSTPFGGNPLMEAIKNIGRAYSAKKATIRADRTIAVSKHVKKYLTMQWKIKPERIGVVYHGINVFDGVSTLQIPDHLKSLQGRKIIFTAGSIRPARGLEDLLLAFSLMLNDNPSIKLVIAGSTDPGMKAYKSKLDTLIKKLGITISVIWAGSLSEREMSWCYHNSDIFVMTSRVEACPNVVLEAMSHGCVCVSTETAPMPEFFRDAAVYYPPKDQRALSEALQKVLLWDNEKRYKVSEQARNRASQFSWDVCANKTVKELRIAKDNYTRGKIRI